MEANDSDEAVDVAVKNEAEVMQPSKKVYFCSNDPTLHFHQKVFLKFILKRQPSSPSILSSTKLNLTYLN